MDAITCPIIFAEGRGLSIFDDAAEAYLEPVDVADGLFSGYDAEGRMVAG